MRRLPLGVAPTRPGEMPARLVLEVACADGAGVPAGLRAAVAIEAARCLASAARLCSVDAVALEARLDRAAAADKAPAVTPMSAHRLTDYARQLRTAGPTLPAEPRALEVLVPSRQMAAWALAAADAALPVEAWAQRQLDVAPASSLAWEAAAAARAMTLFEWVLAQPVPA